MFYINGLGIMNPSNKVVIGSQTNSCSGMHGSPELGKFPLVPYMRWLVPLVLFTKDVLRFLQEYLGFQV